MSTPKITWNQLHEHTQHEIRDGYGIGYGKLADRKLENAVRRHLDGANAQERAKFYDKFYGRKK